MDRIEAASEARRTRTSDFPSYHDDYVSPSGYPSLSLYNAFDTTPVSSAGFSDPRSRDGLGVKEGHTEPLSRDGYGGYSYSSSYDDMRKSALEGRLPYTRQFEDSKPFEASAYDKYGYGANEDSSLRESYKDPSYDRSYYKSVLRASSGPLTSGLYGDDGPRSANRHHDLSYQGTTDSYQSHYDYSALNKSDIVSLNQPDILPFEQSAAVRERYAILQPHDLTYPPKDTNVNCQQPYRTPQEGVTAAATDYQQASGLSRKYDSNFSGMLPTFGPLGDWRNAGGRVHDSDDYGWQCSGSLLSNVQEPYTLGRVGNGSRVMEDSVYSDLKDLNKFGMWDGGVVKQAQPGLPSEIGSKVDYNEGSMRMPGIDLGRETTEKKKRRSRWEPLEENEKSAQNGSEKKKKKSRWSEEKPPAKEVNLPDILKGVDSDLIALRAQLIIVNKKLQSGQVVDDRPEAERSPSPEPVFDNFGYRVNTREFRARERLTKERQRIIAKLSEKSVTFKPPPDFKQAKFSRKLYIPIDKYPEYNFIGLIIGPRGHTQKKMEKESGAKIFIRGKGSVREGSSALTMFNESENLHVLIEADTEDSVNKAVGMVEKLLVPVGDGHNEHKKAQLRELATLNGTLRSSESCHVCKEAGHVAKDCPMAGSTAGSSAAVGTSQDNEHCHVCKGHGHLSKDCPSSRPTSGSLLKGGSLGSGGHQVTELDSRLSNDSDNTLLYVAFLPLSVNDAHLRSLFSPFGQVVHAKVMRHLTTGISKSYGFVKFLDAADAAQAVALMNGYKLDGKVLLVKLKINAEAAS